jgi:hypothetical protein
MSSKTYNHFRFGNNFFKKSYVKRVFMVQHCQTEWYVVCVEGTDQRTFTISYKNQVDAETQMGNLNNELTGGSCSFYFESNTDDVIYTSQFDEDGNKVADASGGLVVDAVNTTVGTAFDNTKEESKNM